MPTLLDVNKIVIQSWHKPSDKQFIRREKSIDWIIGWIKDRTQLSKDVGPKIPPKEPGDRVLVLKSGTGSGKSTVLPMALYNEFYDSTYKTIIVTEPTRATTAEIPYDIIKHNSKMKLGENIGYQTGIITRKATKGILFATIGILLQFLKTFTDEQFIHKYAFILIDEVHTRSIDVDLTLFYIKRLLERNWKSNHCPMVILMSGTLDPVVYLNYFSCNKRQFIDVIGSTFPTTNHFAKFEISNYIAYIVDLVEKIHVENIDEIDTSKYIDILVFVQGRHQIKEICDRIDWLNANVFDSLDKAQKHTTEQQKKYPSKLGGGSNCYLAPIGIMSDNITRGSKEYMDLISDIKSVMVDIYKYVDGKKDKVIKIVPATRRVFIGTNSIETGITISTLKYCIDSGYVKDIQFNPNYGCRVLIDKNVTRASAWQRRGRTGRESSGEFYMCYTEETFKLFQELPFPDIIKEDISSLLLNIIIQETETTIIDVDFEKRDKSCFQMNLFNQQWYKLSSAFEFDASTMDFIQYPSSDSLNYSIEKLHILGFIDCNYIPTIFGIYAAKFRRLSFENIRMILASYHTGANTLDLITIACFIELSSDLAINKRKYKPRNVLNVSEEEAYWYYKIVFADEFIEYLFIYNDFMEAVDTISKLVEKNTSAKGIKSNKLPINYLPEWCESIGISYDGILRICELRDDVISDMLIIGLNPYYNELDLPRGTYNLAKILSHNINEGMEEIVKIKKSIYEGYRFNVCIYNTISKSYVNQTYHYTVTLDSKLIKYISGEFIQQNQPQKIIVANVLFRPSVDNSTYEFSGNDVSVLDGFVDVDMEFNIH
jgi:HrpA-like RNA helicase